MTFCPSPPPGSTTPHRRKRNPSLEPATCGTLLYNIEHMILWLELLVVFRTAETSHTQSEPVTWTRNSHRPYRRAAPAYLGLQTPAGFQLLQKRPKLSGKQHEKAAFQTKYFCKTTQWPTKPSSPLSLAQPPWPKLPAALDSTASGKQKNSPNTNLIEINGRSSKARMSWFVLGFWIQTSHLAPLRASLLVNRFLAFHMTYLLRLGKSEFTVFLLVWLPWQILKTCIHPFSPSSTSWNLAFL